MVYIKKFIGYFIFNGKILEMFCLKLGENEIFYYLIFIRYYNGCFISIIRKRKEKNEKKDGKEEI